MKALFTHFGAYATFFGLMDAFFPKQLKESVSSYIFGFERTDFPKVEKDLVEGLVRFVLPKNLGIRFLRLWLVSFFLTLVVLTWSLSREYSYLRQTIDHFEGGELVLQIAKILFLFLIVSIFSIPTDYCSALVTRKIFVGKHRSIWAYPLWMALDIAISVLMVCSVMLVVAFLGHVAGIASFTFDPFEPIRTWLSIDGFFKLWWSGMTLSSISIIFLTLVQMFALGVGSMARFLSGVLKVNQWMAMNSEALRFPFTFIGIFLAIIVGLVQLLIR